MQGAGAREEITADLGFTYALVGKEAEARELIETVKRQWEERYVAPSIIARLYVGIGETDEAFRWLETAYGERDALVLLLHIDPIYDGIREDPRFSDLLRRMGLET
jgi:serine/threonine-protein kinase